MSRGLRFTDSAVLTQLAKFRTESPKLSINRSIKAKGRVGRQKRNLEQDFELQLKAAGIQYLRELKFMPNRRWRLDFRILDFKFLVAVEVEGVTWQGGRHQRREGYEKDLEKYNEAVLLGYRLIRVSAKHIDSGQALEWVKRAIGQK